MEIWNEPGVKALMEDVKAGKIDVIVVYKVDRLTRALSDFAKIVDVLDEHKASFVSVTQQFNTTTSMGRLTLNVLLSFAQFEREVTSERIRDKIAASKKKGMWMGGSVPLGYDAVERKLVINKQEAKSIRFIFEHYLKVGHVTQLRDILTKQGIVSKRYKKKTGRVIGGKQISTGNLYNILRNPIYMGKIRHNEEIYEGLHEGIIDEKTFQQAQKKLENNRRRYTHSLKAKEPSLLCGLIFDADGTPFTPTHGGKYQGKRLRYYVNNKKLKKVETDTGYLGNLPAQDIEDVTIQTVQNLMLDEEKISWLGETAGDKQHLIDKAKMRHDEMTSAEPGVIHKLVRTLVAKVVIHEDRVDVQVRADTLKPYLLNGSTPLPDSKTPVEKTIAIEVPVTLKRFRKSLKLVTNSDTYGTPIPQPNPTICKALARAFVWNEMLTKGEVTSLNEIARMEGVDSHYVRKIIKLAYLSPEITITLLSGEYPEMSVDMLTKSTSLHWQNKSLFINP